MTIKELADYSELTERTVKKKIDSIKGVTKNENGEYIIPDGSRYPYDAHRYKFKDRGKRIKALLDATHKYRYVDHEILRMPENSFNQMVNELVTCQYLQSNGSENPYGVNRYDTTIQYEENSDKEILNKIASLAGHFAGALADEL